VDRFRSLPLHPGETFEREEIRECDGHIVHKLSQQRLTADWLAPRESDCSRMHRKVSSDWLPSYIKATRTILEIFKMAGYFPDSPRIPFENGWTPQRYWKLWRRKKSFASEGTEQKFLGYLAFSLKTISTTLISISLGKFRICMYVVN
jgi:hypothetical protein